VGGGRNNREGGGVGGGQRGGRGGCGRGCLRVIVNFGGVTLLGRCGRRDVTDSRFE